MMSLPERVSRDAAVTVIRATADRLAALVPAVADQVLVEVRNAAPDAQRLPVDLHRRLVRRGLDTGVETLRGAPGERPDLSFAEDIGRRCAEIGLAVDVVLRTYRVAGRRLWEAVIEIVADTDPASLAVLPYTATEFWQAIDEQSVVAAEAYQKARWEQVRRSRERRRALVDALLAGHGDDPEVARAAVAVLGLPERGRYAVVMVRGSGDDDPGRESVDVTGPRFIWTVRADREVAVVDLSNAAFDDLLSVVRRTACRHTGISPVVTCLAELGNACRLAGIALRTCVRPGPEVAVLDRRLAAGLVAAQPELGRELARTVDPTDTLTPADRTLLLETFTTWLDCGGSVARTAARMYCHRNTVNNRLRRLFGASGRTVEEPWDLVEVALATIAIRIGDNER